jgi:hypothetical protein
VGVKIPAPETARRREGADPHGVSGCRLGEVGSSKFDVNLLVFRKYQLENRGNQIC